METQKVPIPTAPSLSSCSHPELCAELQPVPLKWSISLKQNHSLLALMERELSMIITQCWQCSLSAQYSVLVLVLSKWWKLSMKQWFRLFLYLLNVMKFPLWIFLLLMNKTFCSAHIIIWRNIEVVNFSTSTLSTSIVFQSQHHFHSWIILIQTTAQTISFSENDFHQYL